jgi:MFS family permease
MSEDLEYTSLPGRFLLLGRAFRSRNYRLYFLGQGISLIGTWMQTMATSWLVYSLTGSPFLLGLAGFVTQVPAMVLTPFTGVLADRWNRYRMMILVQFVEMVLALVMAVLTLLGWIRLGHVLVLGFFFGVANALDAPNRHSFVVDLVDRREDLPNAIALNSAMFNGARLVGPALAGILIEIAGEGLCFLLNALSFLAVIFALRAMHIKARQSRSVLQRGILREFRAGFHYTFKQPAIRLVIIHFAVVSLLGMSFTVLMPVLAKDILQGGSKMLGFLMGAMGSGALLGALLLAARRGFSRAGKLIALSSTIFGLGLLLLSASRHPAFSLPVMVIVGLGMISQMNASNTFLQTIISDGMRARVMGFYLLAFFGTVPLGCLLIGYVASLVGVPEALLLSGLGSLVSSALFAWRFRHHERLAEAGSAPKIFP